VGHGGRAGRVIDFHGDQRLARDIGNGRLEVLRDGLRFAIMCVDGPAIEKARAAQVAAMMVRIFMDFLLLSIGWSSFFIVTSRPAGLLITDTERVSLAG